MMADFCMECSIEMFGQDYGDMKGITTAEDWANGMAAIVLCEECGVILVDPDGKRVDREKEKAETPKPDCTRPPHPEIPDAGGEGQAPEEEDELPW